MPFREPGSRIRVLTLGAGPPTTGGIPMFLSLLSDYAAADPELAVDFINSSPRSGAGILGRLATSLRVSCVLMRRLARRYHVVHIHVSGPRSFLEKSAFCLVCRAFRTPTVLHFHASSLPPYYEKLPGLGKKAVTWLLKQPNKVVVPYASLKGLMEEIAKQDNVRVVANGITPLPEMPQRDPMKAETEVVFLGHIMDDKGLFVLLRALTQMRETRRGLVVHLAGTEQRKGDFSRIKGAFESSSLRDVHFHGHLGEGDRDSLLLRGDIFVLPSLEEAFPFAVLEAMNYGLPIVATGVGGIPELVEDGVNGYLIEPGDSDQLARALTKLAGDRETRLRMGKRNYEKVRHQYSFEETLRQLKVVYLEVAKRRTGDHDC